MNPNDKLRMFLLVFVVLPMVIISVRMFFVTEKEKAVAERIGSIIGFCFCWLCLVGGLGAWIGSCVCGVELKGGVDEPEQGWYRGL